MNFKHIEQCSVLPIVPLGEDVLPRLEKISSFTIGILSGGDIY
jgi:hypothetical protein